MRAPSFLLGAVLLCGMLGVGCGKKGPPLAPIVHVPAAIEQLGTHRVGDDVYVTLTIPSQNIDASMPADVRRVEIYGATAMTPPPRGRFLEIAELVDTVQVTPPVTRENPAPAAVGDVTQGSIVTVRDALAPADLVPRELPVLKPEVRRPTPLPAVEIRGELRRYYLAIAFNERGRQGPAGLVAELPLIPPPEAPMEIELSYTPDSVVVAWNPSGGLIGFLLNQALPLEPPPFDEFVPVRGLPDVPLTQPPTTQNTTVLPPPPALAPPAPQSTGTTVIGPARYNIYRELEADPFELPTVESSSGSPPSGPPKNPASALPVNPMPLDGLMFTDELEFERERCYVVRAAREAGPHAIEGYPSKRHCIRPVDIFPPSAPVGLSAVAAEGSISLIWEANTEGDVAGYLILRGSTADATLLPLTDAPIAETQFIDRTVTSGERYAYAVVAVDNRIPLPNVSEESMRVEETAR